MRAAIGRGMQKIEALLDTYRDELRVQFAVAGELAGL